MLSGWNNNYVIWVEQKLCYLGGTKTMLSEWNNIYVIWVEQ